MELLRLIPSLTESPDAGVRLGAALALQQWLAQELDTSRDFAALLQEYPGLLPALVQALGDQNKGVQVTVADCLQFLAYQSAEVVPALRATLTGETWRAWGAALVLGRMQLWSAELGPVLTQAFGAADKDVRWAAASMCVRLGRSEPAAVDAVRAAIGHPNAIVRKMAAYAMGAMGAYAAVEEALCRGLADPERDVRRATLIGLSRLQSLTPETVEQMRARRKDPDLYVRRVAAAVSARRRA